MSRLELTRSALADIDELWTYIADDNAEAADRVSSAILDACAMLADRPRIGHARTVGRYGSKPFVECAALPLAQPGAEDDDMRTHGSTHWT